MCGYIVKVTIHGKKVVYKSEKETWMDAFEEASSKYGPCASIVLINGSRSGLSV